jgi:hypothetical protein
MGNAGEQASLALGVASVASYALPWPLYILNACLLVSHWFFFESAFPI